MIYSEILKELTIDLFTAIKIYKEKLIKSRIEGS